ncbi:outer membrane beta-barrel protein [Kaarinaea lacus]
MRTATRFHSGFLLLTLVMLALLMAVPHIVYANPAFARQYGLSCTACHAAFPRLNSFGEQFLADNIRLPNWREAIGVDTGDEQLMLPKFPPLAVRAQAFVQARQAEAQDEEGNTVADSTGDFQVPYLIKLISGSPLSEHISYYFYAILAEKGENGSVVVEDAWITHDNVFNTGVGMMLGQFQVSDLMFPRETRLTVQDFIPYRMAGITYERGVTFDANHGPMSFALGVVNGNGIDANYRVNSAGYQRTDRAFDNDNNKSVFGRFGADIGAVNLGLFGLGGKQSDATGSRDTDKQVLGVDASGNHEERLFWFVQLLYNRWDGFLVEGEQADWYGGFAGVDYVFTERWAFSLLYNYADANDFANSGTVYEGIDLNSLTGTASYYFMRNVKGIIELNVDLLAEYDDTNDGIGHNTKEGYLLMGFDAAF